jgi:hypothetical protein
LSVGTLASLSVTGNADVGNLNAANTIVIATGYGGNILGANNITANYFIGNGSLLTSLTGANVTGEVANATYANIAGIAYSVDAANVVGNVAFANASETSNIANIAYSVDAANVVGNVAFANASETSNIANIAYSVDAANVVGNVAFANASETSNIANIAYSVDAANIVGNVAFANVAEFVSNATQSNITAVGTLSDLSVVGNVTADYFIGNGSLLTGISGGGNASQIANGTSNVTIPSANGVVDINVVSNYDTNVTNKFTFDANGRVVLTTANTAQTSAFVTNVYNNTNQNAGSFSVQRARGTLSAPLSVQPGDGLTQIAGIGYNGTAFNTQAGSFRAVVDSSYVANAANIPINWIIRSIGNSNNQVETTFHSNGSFLPAGNIVTIANSDHNLGNSVTGNFFIGNGSQLTGLPASSIIANGTSNVSIPTANGNIVGSMVSDNDANINNTFEFNANGTMFINCNSTNSGTSSGILFNTYRTGTSAGRGLTGFRYRGNINAPAPVQGNDVLIRMAGFGANSSNIMDTSGGGTIGIEADNFTSGNIVPTRVRFVTTSNVAGTPTFTSTIFAANGQFTPGSNIVTIANSDHNLGNSVTANYFIGNGSLLTSLTGANVTGTVPTANIANLVNVSNANGSSANTFYPVFVSAAGNQILNIDQSANTLLYVPATGIFTAGQFSATYFVNGGGEEMWLDGTNNIVKFNVNSVQRFTISTTGVTANGTLSVSGNANIGNIGAAGLITSNNVTVNNFLTVGVYTAAALTAITGVVGQMACVSNSGGGGNPNGMIAFWDTTNSRWSYIHDNSAV